MNSPPSPSEVKPLAEPSDILIASTPRRAQSPKAAIISVV